MSLNNHKNFTDIMNNQPPPLWLSSSPGNTSSSSSMGLFERPKLYCHCDHCPNNTCTTNTIGRCYTKTTKNSDDSVVKEYNCLYQKEDIFSRMVCEAKSDNRSTITCCKTNFCNTMDPSPTQAKLDDSTIGTKVAIVALQYSAIFLVILLTLVLTQRYRDRLRRRKVQLGNRQQRAENISINCNGNHTQPNATTNNSITDTNVNQQFTSLNNISAVSSNSFSNNQNNNNNINNNNINNNNNTAGDKTKNVNNHNRTNQDQNNHNSNNNKASPKSDDEIDSANDSNVDQQVTATTTASPTSNSAAFRLTSDLIISHPNLTQRSIADDIELNRDVGRGYFGRVCLGRYRGEPVAVKIFSMADEASWKRESDIYQTTLLRHKNLLGFIAADKRDDATLTGYWLVTEYYPMGSLYDFLNMNSLSMPDTIRMAFSIANGLSHLHSEIHGIQAKPAIAHRDIKSKNILVKNDGTCCIADLGMAVRYSSTKGIIDPPGNTRVGTRRYLAPEILNNKINLLDFDSVRATDVYSLGLVYWELLRRACSINPAAEIAETTSFIPICDPYQVPYQDNVPPDPSIEDMHQVVCVLKIRPPRSKRWLESEPMHEFCTIMNECWYEKPQARLSALRVRKTLGEIARVHFNISMEYD